MDISAILSGLGAGLTFGLTTYIRKSQDQKFDPEKLASTVVIGGVCGIAMSLTGEDMTVSYEFMISMGLVPIVENGLKFLYRKVIAPIAEKIMNR